MEDAVGKIVVVTDSGSALSPQMAQENGVTVVPILVIFEDEVLRDGVDITASELYKRLRVTEEMPTTSAPTPFHFEEVYQAAKDSGAEGVVVTSLSEKLSLTHNSAVLGAKAMGDFPVRIVDTYTATIAQGFVAIDAARAAAQGADLEEVVAVAEESRTRCGFLFVLDTLEYLHRSGRVPAIASMAGSFFKLNPILTTKKDGTVGICATSRGMRKSILRMLAEVEKRAGGTELEKIGVMHGDVPDDLKILSDAVEKNFSYDELYTTEISPVMGVHAGPGLIGLAYQQVA